MSTLINGIHHIAIKCENYEAFTETIHFYRDILGLSVKRSWGEGEKSGIMLSADGVLLEIFAAGRTSQNTGSVNHFAFATDRVKECVETVRQAGYPILMEPKDIVIPAEIPYPAEVAFCKGPNGEEIEFFCEK